MRKIVFLIALVVVMVVAGCTPRQTDVVDPLPTNTPLPTFTPTPEIVVTPVDPAAVATATAEEEAPTATEEPVVDVVEVDVTDDEADDEQPADEATPEPPTPTPAPAEPVAVIDQPMNIRSGPGTNYQIIGSATAGQQYPITGKNPAGDWWQIDFNGQTAWIYGPLIEAENADDVQVAANIPPTPTPAPATPTPVPQPTATPAPAEPTPTPAPQYQFNIAVVGRCDPNAGVTYVQGRTYVNGQPQSGYSVAFSYAPDGPIVAQVQSGPHEGYPNWDAGFYSHILQADGPREGDWYFWIVDGSGNRISEMAHVHTHGEAGPGKCQQAVVDFDSR